MIEKRISQRAPVRLPAHLQLKGTSEWREVLIQDLSEAGAAILLPFELPLSTEVRVRFRLAPDAPANPRDFETSCLIVRMSPSSHPDPRWTRLVGVHFLSLRDEDFDCVRAFVWRLMHAAES